MTAGTRNTAERRDLPTEVGLNDNDFPAWRYRGSEGERRSALVHRLGRAHRRGFRTPPGPAGSARGAAFVAEGVGDGGRRGAHVPLRGALRRLGAARGGGEEIYAADQEFTGWGFDDGRAAVAVSGRAARGPRPLRTLPARAWRGLRSLEAAVEERILRTPGMRRLALRRGPG